MLIYASVIVIFCGIVCLRDAEFAWQIYEWDCRTAGMEPPRLLRWRQRVQQVGYTLVCLGLLGMIVSIS